MIRVDHAGEYGAARIYAGQLAVLRRSDSASVLREMQAQEQQHLDRFADLIVRRRVRPPAMLPLWHLAGFALGGGAGGAQSRRTTRARSRHWTIANPNCAPHWNNSATTNWRTARSDCGTARNRR